MTLREVRILVVLLLVIAFQPAAAQEATPELGRSEPREIELPGTRILSLSPDGRSLAAVDARRQLCVYDVETLAERTCGDLDALQIALSFDSVVWSPDSTRIAIAEEAFRFLTDGDLWLMDAATGEITNLTDDGFDGRLPFFGEDEFEGPIYIDILPVWAPDGRSITFSRSTMRRGQRFGNEIVRLDLDNGETERLLLVSFDQLGIVYFGLAWAPDGQRLYYAVNYRDTADRRNGVWAFDTESGLAEHVLRNDPEKGPPVLLRVAATSRTGLIYYPVFMMQYAGGDFYALLDLETGELSPVNPTGQGASPPDIVRAAAFSPDGTEVVYSVWHSGDANDLMVWAPPDGQPTVVAAAFDGQLLPTTLGGSLVWAEDGTVFVSTATDTALLLQLGP